MVSRAGGKGGWELLCNGYRVSVSQDKKGYCDGGGYCTTMWMCDRTVCTLKNGSR